MEIASHKERLIRGAAEWNKGVVASLRAQKKTRTTSEKWRDEIK